MSDCVDTTMISITTCDSFCNWHDTCQPFTHLALGAYPIRRLELAQARHNACEENRFAIEESYFVRASSQNW